mmetsp:Transcript_34697/g.39588  ORF Transcript_34697/g.39588 Transcript_34697/m.39588 type:complete len:194 (+) Transcript_34697:118-699(+)
MSIKEEGEHNQDHIDWKRSITAKKTTKQNILNIVYDEIDRRFKSINDKDWFLFRNGSVCNRQPYAKAMVRYAIYFNRSFTMAMYGMLLGLVTPHHNMVVAKYWLICLGIMVESDNNISVKAYGIVEIICKHVQYKEDNGIEKQLIKLLSVGNVKITARKIKINTSGNKRKQVTVRAAKIKVTDSKKKRKRYLT